MDWDKSVCTPIGYGLEGPSSILDSARVFSSQQRLFRLWDHPSLLYNMYLGLFTEAAHTSECSAEVKNGAAIPLFSHMSSRHTA
jgi:hypothetical protein